MSTSNELKPPVRRLQLAKVLGLPGAIAIGIGALIGGGIFTLTGIALGYTGPSLLVAVALNGIIALMTAFTYAELGSAYPVAGGAYTFVKRGLGGAQGYLSGWISWFANSVACSLYALSFGFYATTLATQYLLPRFGVQLSLAAMSSWQKAVAILIILTFGYINYRGIKTTGRFQNATVAIEVLALLSFVGFGLVAFLRHPPTWENFQPFFGGGYWGLMAAMGLMYIGFEGSEIIVQSGEELKSPERNIPRAIFISFAIVTTLYVLVILVAIGGVSIPWRELSQAGQGTLVAAAGYFMPGWEWIIIAGGFIAALAALNATVFSSSRVSFAMGRAGSLPRFLAQIHPSHRTPHIAVIVSTLVIALMAAFLPLKDVASIADLLFILLFMQLHFALIALRKKEPETKRPFSVPLYPLPQIIALVAYFVLIWQFTNISPAGLAIALIWVLTGLVIYYAYSVPREAQEIERLTVFEEKMKFNEKAHYRILLPMVPEPGWKGMLKVALSIAKAKDGEIHVLRITEVPPPSPLEVAGGIADSEKEFLERVVQICKAEKVNVGAMHMVSRDVSQTVLDVARKMDADLLILGWRGYSRARRRIFGQNLERMLRQIRCDLAVIKLSYYEGMERVLVAVSDGANVKLAAEVAASLAQASQGRITVLHSVAPDLSEQVAQAEFEQLLLSFPKNLAVDSIIAKGTSLAAAVLDAQKTHDVIIMASPGGSMFRGILLGDAAEQVARRTTRMLIVIRHHGEIMRSLLDYIKERFSGATKPALDNSHPEVSNE